MEETLLKLYLVRHTTPLFEAGTCYGQTDIDVANSFVDECKRLRQKIAGISFDAVFSSPLQRCGKLAIAMQLGPVQFDTRIQELNFGDWEMQKWSLIKSDEFEVWSHNYAQLAPPNGETFTELHTRSTEFISDLKHKYMGKNIAVFSHGGVIRAMLAEVLNMPLKGLFRFTVDYASVTLLDFSGKVPNIGYMNR